MSTRHAPPAIPSGYYGLKRIFRQSMVDIVDTATRSRMMSGIRGRDTKPEKVIRSLLHAMGFRFRVNRRDLPGKPDIVFPGLKAVVLVHGCFWHGHDCPMFRLPGTRTEFWAQKIGRNRENDLKVTQALLDAGWRVGIVWECALRGRGRDISGAVEALATWLRSDSREIELRGNAAVPGAGAETAPRSGGEPAPALVSPGGA